MQPERMPMRLESRPDMAADEFPVDHDMEFRLRQAKDVTPPRGGGGGSVEEARARYEAEEAARREREAVPEHMRFTLDPSRQTKEVPLPPHLKAIKDPQLRRELVDHWMRNEPAVNNSTYARWVRMAGGDEYRLNDAIQAAKYYVAERNDPMAPGRVRTRELAEARTRFNDVRLSNQNLRQEKHPEWSKAFAGWSAVDAKRGKQAIGRAADAGDIPLPKTQFDSEGMPVDEDMQFRLRQQDPQRAKGAERAVEVQQDENEIRLFEDSMERSGLAAQEFEDNLQSYSGDDLIAWAQRIDNVTGERRGKHPYSVEQAINRITNHIEMGGLEEFPKTAPPSASSRGAWVYVRDGSAESMRATSAMAPSDASWSRAASSSSVPELASPMSRHARPMRARVRAPL
jgi:hypothetical protein